MAVTDPNGRTTAYGYDAAGNPAAVTDPDGATITQTWDAAGHLTDVAYSDPDTPDVGFSYDAVRRVTHERRHGHGHVRLRTASTG